LCLEKGKAALFRARLGISGDFLHERYAIAARYLYGFPWMLELVD
jgi:hypothetical protein